MPFRPRGRCGRLRCSERFLSFGRSAWITRPRSGRSSPRAATSVATQTRARPSRSACSAWLRSVWLSSPESATTEKPRSLRLACRWRDAVAGRAEHERAGRVEEAEHVDDGVLALARRDRDGAGTRCRRAARRSATVAMRSASSGSASQARRSPSGCVAENISVRRSGGVASRRPRGPRGSPCRASRRPRRARRPRCARARACRARGDRAGVRACRRRCARRARGPRSRGADPCRRRRTRCARRSRRRATQLAMHLQGELARRRDDEGERRAGLVEALRLAEQRRRRGRGRTRRSCRSRSAPRPAGRGRRPQPASTAAWTGVGSA